MYRRPVKNSTPATATEGTLHAQLQGRAHAQLHGSVSGHLCERQLVVDGVEMLGWGDGCIVTVTLEKGQTADWKD